MPESAPRDARPAPSGGENGPATAGNTAPSGRENSPATTGNTAPSGRENSPATTGNTAPSGGENSPATTGNTAPSGGENSPATAGNTAPSGRGRPGVGRAGLFGGVFARGDVDAGPDAWLGAMLETEAALARAVERAGLVPQGAGAAVTAAISASIDQRWLAAQSALTGNPVPALVAELRRAVPRDAAAAVHCGATSQDIMDTAAMLLANRALGLIDADVARAGDAAARLAAAHRNTIMVGRTLLQQAVPVTFGLVAAGWLSSLDEAAAALRRVREQRLAVQFGGAAGTLASLGSDGVTVRRLLADELGLGVAPLPWHTDRLRIVEIAAACAGVAAALGKIARDVTLLAQSEIGEVREGDTPAESGTARRAPLVTNEAAHAGVGDVGAAGVRDVGGGGRDAAGRAGVGDVGAAGVRDVGGGGRDAAGRAGVGDVGAASVRDVGGSGRDAAGRAGVRDMGGAGRPSAAGAGTGGHESAGTGDMIASTDGGPARRGGSSAMPHKRNPVAAISILGCTRQVPGLLATLAAAAEQEHQRAAGAWHAEWEPFSDVLRLTGSASSWAVELLTGLVADPVRMKANLDAAHQLPLAESLAGLLAPALGTGAAQDLVAQASEYAVTAGIDLREALLGPVEVRQRLEEAGISIDQIDSALDPANYLGATHHFIDAALEFHLKPGTFS